MPFIQPPKPPQPGPLVPNHAKPTMLVMKNITPPIRDKIKEVVSPWFDSIKTPVLTIEVSEYKPYLS
jgi:hypothetical protein